MSVVSVPYYRVISRQTIPQYPSAGLPLTPENFATDGRAISKQIRRVWVKVRTHVHFEKYFLPHSCSHLAAAVRLDGGVRMTPSSTIVRVFAPIAQSIQIGYIIPGG